MFNKIKTACRMGLFLIIGILLYVGLNPDHCTAEDWSAHVAGQAIVNGATYTAEGKTIVQNGVILDYNYFYEHGATDADISQWQAEAATNGISNPSSTSTITNDNQSTSNDSTNSNSSVNTDENSNTTTNSSSSSNSSQTTTQPSYTDEEIEAAWEETNRVESTCTEAGFVEYRNTLTGDTKTDTLELAEHDYVETERVESTCTEDGTVTKVCSVCGDTYTEIIPATGHATDNWVITKESGLFSEGLKQEVCPVCGEVLAEQTIPQTCPLPLYAIIILVVATIVLVVAVVYKVKRKQNKIVCGSESRPLYSRWLDRRKSESRLEKSKRHSFKCLKKF